ncbi:ParB/RepB/Spo0J family partition protein [Leadbetterella byssophila]|uniref:ParB-like partition protein n=1 Tax=Leadbetterella byssophila (strain DSM 17132 / JCM 16389 / KACC 11308 / NBRC 106382 / 4M15) TaxID=649349 RepID=E4RTP5_LEAB4|nr:ParB/RepB/Spo0J family partition protein [Leadbetterella byssophila]ADQ17769.1 parB-like partition protein [Leadbetterella byssophila DSM 17132]
MENKGKGLNSLLGDSDLVVKRKVAAFVGVKEVEVDRIVVGSSQPRKSFDESALRELADSIKLQGLIQPITVRETSEGKLEIISGERRFRASKLAGLTRIPAYIREVDDQRSLEMALIENIQRENLNPIEIALSYRRMMEELGFRQEDLGQRVGKSRSNITNFLRLLQLPTEIQTGLVLGVVTVGQVRPLIPVNDPSLQMDIYQKILEDNLSAREVEALVKRGNAFEAQANELEMHREDMRIEEMTLKGKTKVPIKIKVQDINKGQVTIRFSNADDLEKILQKLK